MEKFYVCNFLGESLERKFNKGVTKVEISGALTESVQLAKPFLVDGGKTLRFVSEGESCEGLEFDFIGTFNAEDKRVNSTVEELQHTEDNPIILVATKKFKVYNGIPTYIKYMPVKDGVLIALIKGYISVLSADGEMIPLSRNCDELSMDIGKVFNADDVQRLNALPDKESDVLYSDYVINDCIICIETTKDGRDITNLKFSKEHFTYLNKKVFDDAKAAKEEQRRKYLEEKERREEEKKNFLEEQRAKALREEEGKKVAKTSKKKENVQTGFEGAKSFLAFVEGVKRGQ